MSESSRFTRSLEDVQKISEQAKLANDELMPLTQSLFYSDAKNEFREYKFLEMDTNILNEIISGNEIYIKGESAENVVLCSNDLTYDVKEADTSNNILLIPNLKWHTDSDVIDSGQKLVIREVTGIFHSYLEIKQCKPKLEKMITLLDSTKYSGPEREFEINKNNIYTFNELLTLIQSSYIELKSALTYLKAVEIDTKVRILEFSYHFRVLSYMVDLIDENSWKLDEISMEETIESLKELIPKEIVKGLFNHYTEPSKIQNGKQLYRYKEQMVCVYLAEALLRNSIKLRLEDFIQAWQESVPIGMKTNEEMLEGLAVMEKDVDPQIIWMFREEDLPEDIEDRFKVLFQTKERWTKEQILPYVKNLTTEKKTVNSLLTKYSRTFNHNGVHYYLAKHGK